MKIANKHILKKIHHLLSGEFAKALKITFLGLKTIYILKCNI